MNRKLLPLVLLVVAALFQSCEGPKGDPGPQGGDVLGRTFDIINVDFTSANNFGYVLNFKQQNIEVVPTDAVLVYVYWNDQGNLKAYRPLPQTAFLDNGVLVTYNFDRTDDDMEIFIDSNIDRAKLPTTHTRGFEFRVIVIPSDPLQRANAEVDLNDYEAVVKAFNIDESKIKKISAQ
ncbi:hypothetical protein SAMN05216327_1116 [Dyadobacter sp. SG02]|uniref:hypothetical protein n=1 Tax=Dyadobacter sp. SG02 TaxID=1855291 RepID=UPI0008AFE7D7|nr:hypothetical protein [Dyadobacter sp. SG02]SEJ47216.1 hypothetical protein SAMN05216327_1116 [Dyadobacter sp. SG02]